MPDLVFVILTVVFFAVPGAGRQGGRAAVSLENVAGLVLSVLLLGYLVVALLFPERF